MVTELAEKVASRLPDASPEALRLVLQVLEQSAADEVWAARVGPALAQADVALLLGKTEQAVSKDRRLLRVRNRDGRPVYPVLQFDGRRQLPGVADVVKVLTGLEPLTVAGWLSSPLAGEDRTPIELLRSGRLDDVVKAAHRVAADAA
jgi:hypothetical protein